MIPPGGAERAQERLQACTYGSTGRKPVNWHDASRLAASVKR